MIRPMSETEIDRKAVPLSNGSSKCPLMTYQRKETAMTVDSVARKRSVIKPDTLVTEKSKAANGLLWIRES